MARPSSLKLSLTGPAQRDIAAILRRSTHEFGVDASLRYEALIRQALRDIQSDPERPGSRERPEFMIQGARTHHLELSRTRVSGVKVKAPTHFLLYRLREGVIEVARILHDSRDLQRNLPSDYRLD